MGRFFRVEWGWPLDGPDRTKTASSSALLSSDHERGIATGPAIVDVWTPCFFTYGVKFVVFNGGFGGVEHRLLFARWEGGPEPIGKASSWC